MAAARREGRDVPGVVCVCEGCPEHVRWVWRLQTRFRMHAGKNVRGTTAAGPAIMPPADAIHPFFDLDMA